MQTRQNQTWQSASLWRRWLAFNMVGLAGIVVQLVALATFTLGLGWNYLPATLLAVEIAVVHNFFWHERWTWADQTAQGFACRAGRLWRFHAANGAISLLGNLFLMWLFTGIIGIHPVIANLPAIAVCSLANFVASDQWVFRKRRATMKENAIQAVSAGTVAPQHDDQRIPRLAAPFHSSPADGGKSLLTVSGQALMILVGLAFLGMPRTEAAELRPETVRAWNLYAAATEGRINRELGSDQGFLAFEYLSKPAAAAEKKSLLSGEIPVTKMDTLDASGHEIDIPSGMVHHWRGSVFIPGVTIRQVMERIANPTREDARQEDVLDARILGRGADSLALYLKLRRVKFVTVVYNTEHAIRYGWSGNSKAFSRSVATRIAEVENAGSPAEQEKPIGQDHGYLWRLNSYWRYEQVDGGVIVECESISLSRTVPAVLQFMIRPWIDSAARESMTRTLGSMRERMIRMADSSGQQETAKGTAPEPEQR